MFVIMTLFNNVQGAMADTVRKLKLQIPRRHDCVCTTPKKDSKNNT